MLGKLEQLQLYLDLGEYQRGENADNDEALDKQTSIDAFLRQHMAESQSVETLLDDLNQLAS